MSDNDLEASVKARFATDVSSHEMTVQNNTGLYRHLTFKRADTFICGFHVITWPGYLCISGDMGCFVFARLEDMFEFFRGDEINPGYWSGKLEGIDKGGYMSFSEELYRQALKSDFAAWTFSDDLSRHKAWKAIADPWEGILDAQNREEAITKATSWECPISEQRFDSFWEHTIEEHSFRFLWCCFAIQWAIARFDEVQHAPTETERAHG